MRKKQIVVFTWNNKLVPLARGRALLQHLVGPYYIGRVGYHSLLNLEYCIHFERIWSESSSGRKRGGLQGIVYSLLKKNNAFERVQIESRPRNIKRGILAVTTRRMSLRILLRQMPKRGAVNLPLHRYEYQLVAVCLYGANGKIVDIDHRCRDAPF